MDCNIRWIIVRKQLNKIEIMDWKTNIGDYLISNHMNRLKFLNDKLFVFCEEYVKHVNEYYGIGAYDVARGERFARDFQKTVIRIGIKIDGGKKVLADFIFICHYDELSNLCLKYSTDFDFDKKLRSDMKKIMDNTGSKDRDFHVYKEETVTGPERDAKEFIFEVINQELIRFIEMQKAKAKAKDEDA